VTVSLRKSTMPPCSFDTHGVEYRSAGFGGCDFRRQIGRAAG
jgi:hypothetical protein